MIFVGLGLTCALTGVGLISYATNKDLHDDGNTVTKFKTIDVSGPGHTSFPIHIFPYFDPLLNESTKIRPVLVVKYASGSSTILGAWSIDGSDWSETVDCTGPSDLHWWTDDLWYDPSETNYRGIILFDSNLPRSNTAFPACLFPSSRKESLLIILSAQIAPSSEFSLPVLFLATSNATAAELAPEPDFDNIPDGFEQSSIILTPSAMTFGAFEEEIFRPKHATPQRIVFVQSQGSYVNSTLVDDEGIPAFGVVLTWAHDLVEQVTEDDKINPITLAAILIGCITTVFLSLAHLMDVVERGAIIDKKRSTHELREAS